MGFDSLFISYINDAEKDYRKANQLLEFIWQPVFEGPKGAEIGQSPGIFTHVTHEYYTGGCGIDLQVYQSDEVYMKNHFAAKINDHTRNIETIARCIEKYAGHFKTSHVLFTLGADFAF